MYRPFGVLDIRASAGYTSVSLSCIARLEDIDEYLKLAWLDTSNLDQDETSSEHIITTGT